MSTASPAPPASAAPRTARRLPWASTRTTASSAPQRSSRAQYMLFPLSGPTGRCTRSAHTTAARAAVPAVVSLMPGTLSDGRHPESVGKGLGIGRGPVDVAGHRAQGDRGLVAGVGHLAHDLGLLPGPAHEHGPEGVAVAL